MYKVCKGVKDAKARAMMVNENVGITKHVMAPSLKKKKTNTKTKQRKLDSPKKKFTGLLLLTLDRNIVLYQNDNFTKTDSQLPTDPDPLVSLITLRRS